MLPHAFQANKYQSQTAQFANPPAMVVALCEKAISCISAAQEALNNQKKHNWRTNLNMVQDILQLISATLRNSKKINETEEMEKFYETLSLYISGLITDKVDSSKSQDLLEAFRINRDMWKNIEQKYVEMKTTSIPPANSSFDGIL